MAQPIVKEMLFSNGEGIDNADFNGLQRYLSARINDISLIPHLRGSGNEWAVTADQTQLYVLGAGAPPFAEVANRRVVCDEGALVWVNSSVPDGSAPVVLIHWVSYADIDVTIDVGGVQDRYDVISVKVEEEANNAADQESRDFKDATTGVITSQSLYKKRRTKLTVQVTKGVEGASPTEPATPSGFKKWCAVKVPAAFNAPFTQMETYFRDYCVPADRRSSLVIPRLLERSVFTAAVATYACGPAGAGEAFVIPLGLGPSGRLVGRLMRLAMKSTLSAGALVKLVRISFADLDFSPVVTVLRDLSSTFINLGVGKHVEWTADQPYWMSGYPTRIVRGAGAGEVDTRFDTLALQITSGAGTDVLGPIVVDVAVD